MPTTIGPIAPQREKKQKAPLIDAGNSAQDEYHDSVLPAPPTTLEESKGLPSRSRAIPTPLREPALELNGTALIPPFDEDSDVDEIISESKDVVKSCGSQRVLAVRLPDQAAVIAPRSTRKPGRPKKQQPPNEMNWKRSKGELESQVETVISNGKRKAVNELSSSDDATRVPSRHTDRGRPKEQRSNTPSEGSQLEVSAEATPSLGTKRLGRPKKSKFSPLSTSITGDVRGPRAAPTEKEEMTNPDHNGLMQPRSAKGPASIRGKRKMSVSEDELSMPAPKRRNNMKDAKTRAVASTKEPVARRSMRKR